jgi:hypothetical protein
MPSKVRIISPRNSAEWDALVRDAMQRNAYRVEHDYFGIVTEERAEQVRKKLRTAAGHLGVGAKVFWTGCQGCSNGGTDCRYHVKYTLYPLEEARAYKQQQAQQRR